MTKIGVIGTGYVGLVTGACLAEKGNSVVCADIDESKIHRLSQGFVPFYEPGLEEIVRATRDKRHLSFTSDVRQAMNNSELVFIAVGTPETITGDADLRHVEAVADQFADVIAADDRYRLLVTKSTVPPGTTRSLMERIAKRVKRSSFGIANVPEFLKEGSALEDFRKPDRIVIGVEDIRAENSLRELFSPFLRNDPDSLIVTNTPTSELGKYAANGMLAARISFMNEVAEIADKTGADIDAIRHSMGLDGRIGNKFLHAGPGYGGSCFPKDVKALARFGGDVELPLIGSIDRSNSLARRWAARKLYDALENSLKEKTIAVWGASFKPRTDDVRESSTLYFARELLDAGARLSLYDPEPRAIENFRSALDSSSANMAYAESRDDSVHGADGLVILTDWDEFKSPDFEHMKRTMRKHLIVDSRRLYPLSLMQGKGFRYISKGRPDVPE